MKEGEEDKNVESTEVVEEKEPEPEKLTLEEYYKQKGVEISYQGDSKTTVKKEDIKADWIKKEKLTLMSTKEDRKNEEDKKTQQTIKHNSAKTGLDIDEADFNKIGFGHKPAPAPRETQKHEDRRTDKRGGKKNKPQFSNEDFPSL